MSKDDIIELLKDSVPQIQEAYDFDTLQNAWDDGEFNATFDEMHDLKYASQALVLAVETQAGALVKALGREIDTYNRYAI